MWRDLFYFQKSDKRIICLLGVILVVLLGVLLYLDYRKELNPTPLSEGQKQELDDFFAHIEELERSKVEKKTRRWEGKLFPFDPNRADSIDFSRLGLPYWQISNIIKYRQMGGRYRKPEDFSRLYGLSTEDFNRLKPYIQLSDENGESHFREENLSKERRKKGYESEDTIMQKIGLRSDKFTQFTLIEINSADTSLLKKIPGIGSGFAAAIVYRRRQLGGFIALHQLHEVQHLPDSLHRWFTIDTTRVSKLNINKLSVEQLRKHPYLNFYQSKAIVEHRNKYGRLTTLKQLVLYDCFTNEDFLRLAPYIEF